MLLDHPSPIERSPLRLAEVPDPIPGDREVRVRVICCAVCRTDLHVVEGDLPPQKQPVIPGHQIVGVIDQLGAGASRFRVGTRIGIAWLRHTCGKCNYCSSDRENLCPYSRYTGYHDDGGYAEFAVVHEDFAYEIPKEFEDVTASPLLCAGIIGYRALKRTHLPEDGTLAIFGFGSSAHIILQIVRNHGNDVFVVSRSENHQQLARELGATWVGSDAAKMPHKTEAAIVFAPVGSVVPPALTSIAPGGVVSLAGIHMTPIPSLDYQIHLFGERDIHPVTANTREDGRQLLAEAARAHVRPHTTIYPLQDANRALADLKAGRIDGTAVLAV